MNETRIRRLQERANDPQRVTDELTGQLPGPPADLASLAGVEQALGLQFPQLFRQIYLEVGDGNWGPGYGLLPLAATSYGSSATNVLEESRAAIPGKVHFCRWGCTVYSVLDCKNGRVGITDLDMDEPGVWWQRESIGEWLSAWLSDQNLFFEVEDA
ncbi:SMI1/KNR4 family protein [Deinococcus sp.]|uniref:SMI1/KNR4 family protein n=1 Tax=Deinococcus sp. TaxID=47478 RepID=UPI003C7AB4DB